MVIEANPGLKQAELARATRLDRSAVVKKRGRGNVGLPGPTTAPAP